MLASTSRREKKLRGISRRLRSLRTWALLFKESFPLEKELQESGDYWNWKLPTHQAMVEGKHSTLQMKREIAQILVSACANLIEAKPRWAIQHRITCVICVPDMFSSEVCIYLDESYFRRQIGANGKSEGVRLERILGRSLANEWNLALPSSMTEIGTHIEFPGYDDGICAYQGEHWMYGEIDGSTPC